MMLQNLSTAVQVNSGGNLDDATIASPEMRALLENFVATGGDIAYATILNAEASARLAGGERRAVRGDPHGDARVPDRCGDDRVYGDGSNPMLNEWNQLHACKNVFVTDGACMTSTGNQNPSLTFMALTARAANRAVEELKKQNL